MIQHLCGLHDERLYMGLNSEGWVVRLPGEGRAIDMGAFGMTVKVDEGDTNGAFALLEASEPPDFGPPMHVHENAGEAFYVLDGEYHIFIENQEYRCPAGSFVYIPAGVVHGFRVAHIASRKLVIFSPAAMVGYFDELAQAAMTGIPLNSHSLAEMAERYGMHVLGPVPEGYA
jgi:mannose-6-phosphate isomerase-like protein (cupin superfamily)